MTGVSESSMSNTLPSMIEVHDVENMKKLESISEDVIQATDSQDLQKSAEDLKELQHNIDHDSQNDLRHNWKADKLQTMYLDGNRFDPFDMSQMEDAISSSEFCNQYDNAMSIFKHDGNVFLIPEFKVKKYPIKALFNLVAALYNKLASLVGSQSQIKPFELYVSPAVFWILKYSIDNDEDNVTFQTWAVKQDAAAKITQAMIDNKSKRVATLSSFDENIDPVDTLPDFVDAPIDEDENIKPQHPEASMKPKSEISPHPTDEERFHKRTIERRHSFSSALQTKDVKLSRRSNSMADLTDANITVTPREAVETFQQDLNKISKMIENMPKASQNILATPEGINEQEVPNNTNLETTEEDIKNTDLKTQEEITKPDIEIKGEPHKKDVKIPKEKGHMKKIVGTVSSGVKSIKKFFGINSNKKS